MSEIKNSRLGLYGAEHSNCSHMMTLGFKGLMKVYNILNLDGTITNLLHQQQPTTHSFHGQHCRTT